MNPTIPSITQSLGSCLLTIKKGDFAMYIIKQCPMCGAISQVSLNDRESREYLKYNGTKLIQDILPDTHKAVREILLSGYCIGCQNVLFCSNFVEDELGVKFQLQ